MFLEKQIFDPPYLLTKLIPPGVCGGPSPRPAPYLCLRGSADTRCMLW